jgi:hypothetical protein
MRYIIITILLLCSMISFCQSKTPDSLYRLNCIRLMNLNYISGIIYFSGEGFHNVVTFKVGTDSTKLKQLFYRINNGSKISFENVYYKDNQNHIQKMDSSFEYYSQN